MSNTGDDIVTQHPRKTRPTRASRATLETGTSSAQSAPDEEPDTPKAIMGSDADPMGEKAWIQRISRHESCALWLPTGSSNRTKLASLMSAALDTPVTHGRLFEELIASDNKRYLEVQAQKSLRRGANRTLKEKGESDAQLALAEAEGKEKDATITRIEEAAAADKREIDRLQKRIRDLERRVADSEAASDESSSAQDGQSQGVPTETGREQTQGEGAKGWFLGRGIWR